ncbi:MAG: putative Fe-S cluster assembly protein SufT [Vicinamibacteria bacterium]
MREARTLSRDVEAVAIPYGDKIPLKAGITVFVTQSLGGSFTAVTDMGYMVRIEGTDADAIGETAPAGPSEAELRDKSLQELAWDALKTCYDPEIPVNMVDLGLVYSCEAMPVDGGGNRVSVRFTLTAPGCGMGEYLKHDVQAKIAALPGVSEADVEVVLDPPWDQSRMTDAARLQLGLM